MPRRSRFGRFTGSPIRWRAARDAGVPRSRLDASDLERLFRGSRSLARSTVERVPGQSDAGYFNARHRRFVELCRAYLPVAPADFRFSGVTAARLHVIPLPSELENLDELHVTVTTSYPPRMKGVIGHRAKELPPAVIRDGLPVLPVEEVWLQLAAELDVDDLVVAGDHLVRRESPPSAMEKLVAQIAISPRSRGIKCAREALKLIRPRTDSPRETRLRLLIVRAGLPEPLVGFEVRDQYGQFVGVPDLAYPKEKVALDYEGDVHRTDDRTFRKDIERQERFEDAGWRRMRVTKDHLLQPVNLLARLARQLRERGRGE